MLEKEFIPYDLTQGLKKLIKIVKYEKDK